MADCCQLLESIEKACVAGRKTARGLKSHLHIACVDDVASIPAKDDYPTTGAPHTVSTDIVMEVGKVFYKINHDPIGGSMVAETQGEGQSKYYVTNVNIFIPGVAPLPTSALNGSVTGEFVAIVPDKNGHLRLIGTVDDGAIITVTEQSNDKSGYVVNIQHESAELPLFYTGSIPV